MDAKTEARFKVLTVDSWINNDRIAVELSYKSVSTVVKELWDSCMGVKLPLP